MFYYVSRTDHQLSIRHSRYTLAFKSSIIVEMMWKWNYHKIIQWNLIVKLLPHKINNIQFFPQDKRV